MRKIFGHLLISKTKRLTMAKSEPYFPFVPSESTAHPLVKMMVERFIYTYYRSCAALYSDDNTIKRISHGEMMYPGESQLNLNKDFRFAKNLLFYTDAEEAFKAGVTMCYNRRHSYFCLIAVMLYLILVNVGPKIMKNRKPFQINRLLIFWNFFLFLFSVIGTIRILPHVIYMSYAYGFSGALRTPPVYSFGHGAAGLWVLLFTYSKYIELFDTFLLIIRKKPISFLHWYHHSTVLLYTWDAYLNQQPIGVFFAAMNYVVHCTMYLYYFLTCIYRKPMKWGVVVTVLQIAQMLLGVCLTMFTLYLYTLYENQPFWSLEDVPARDGNYTDIYNLFGACLMYSTYFYLFAQFFVGRYTNKKFDLNDSTQSSIVLNSGYNRLANALTPSGTPSTTASESLDILDMGRVKGDGSDDSVTSTEDQSGHSTTTSIRSSSRENYQGSSSNQMAMRQRKVK